MSLRSSFGSTITRLGTALVRFGLNFLPREARSAEPEPSLNPNRSEREQRIEQTLSSLYWQMRYELAVLNADPSHASAFQAIWLETKLNMVERLSARFDP